jgi:PAS domain-containing protein
MIGLVICTALIAAGLVVALLAVSRARRQVRHLEQVAGELARQRALLQAVHDHLPTAMTVVAAMGEGFRLISLNREAARLFGLEAKAAVGRLLKDLPFPAWTAGLWEGAAKRRPAGEDTIQYEQTLGQGRVFSITGTPSRSSSGASSPKTSPRASSSIPRSPNRASCAPSANWSGASPTSSTIC